MFNNGGEYVSKTLKRMRSLERLTLLLNAYNNLDTTIMNCLENGLKGLASFHHLDLTLK